jgi:hypothetical protein
MENVMNNDDLRRHIFSFLRKEPKKKCSICEDVCVWDKTVKHHLDINLSLFGFRNGNSDTYCTECWQTYSILPCTIS